MILILTENDDYSTAEVIDWLIAENKPFVRVNETDPIDIQAIYCDNGTVGFELLISGKSVTLQEIESFWFRRGWFNINSGDFDFSHLPQELAQDISRHLREERERLKDFLYYLVTAKKFLGNPLTDNINKMTTLLKAKEAGLKIPKSIITQDKKRVLEEKSKVSLVTKGIQAVACFKVGLGYVGNYTETVKPEDMLNWNDRFFPSLFQEKLDKKYELRVFYLDGRCFSMCIFSQNDHQTSVDFRKYNYKKPNRVVPYQLPQEIEAQLKTLMQSLPLKTGSIDMVYTQQEEYVFLEVNPIGQFGMVSGPCNYYLEQEIAQYLSDY